MRRRVSLTILSGLALALGGCSGADAATAEPSTVARAGSELLGKPAGEFVGVTWLDGVDRPLASLRGKVVLVRFWTDTCPYCKRTAPALRRLDAEFRARGLVVIGLHHPKPRGRVIAAGAVAATARAWGMEFPIGLDSAWATVDAWWLKTGDREATSASFLLDREGTIRLVHPGPEFSPDGDAGSRRDYAEIRAAIERLLASPER